MKDLFQVAKRLLWVLLVCSNFSEAADAPKYTIGIGQTVSFPNYVQNYEPPIVTNNYHQVEKKVPYQTVDASGNTVSKESLHHL